MPHSEKIHARAVQRDAEAKAVLDAERQARAEKTERLRKLRLAADQTSDEKRRKT